MERGVLLGYRAEGQEPAEQKQAGKARRDGQQNEPKRVACPPHQLEGTSPLTWSPHAGVNHAARPNRAGGTTVSSPHPLWGPALPTGSHPGRKPQG